VRGNPDNPVGNGTLGRNGDFWPIAGGASNCSGKGGPWTFSRGTCALDSGNTTLVNFEVNNDGVGGPWSVQLIDAYFKLSNAINQYLGNLPTDVVGHHHYTPSRKIDPATAGAVQGPWQPRSLNSSGTWNLDDITSECAARAGGGSIPIPIPPGGDDDMVDGIYQPNGNAQYICWTSGTKIWITDDGMLDGAKRMCRMYGRPEGVHDMSQDLGYFAALGLVTGPRPKNTDEWGNFV